MEILRFEFNKFLKNNRGYIIISVALSIMLVISILFSYIPNQNLEMYKEEYLNIVSEYELLGEVTNESEQCLERLIEKCDKAESDFDKLLYRYQLGDINRSEYQKKASELSEITNLKSIIKTIQMQFDYAKENSANRYILYTNGWNLVTIRNFDVIFLLLIILVVTLCFRGDTDGGMKSFLLTCSSGKIKLPIIKLMVCEIIVCISYILHTLVYYYYIIKKYGLPNGNYPVQSLQIYSDYTGDSSLILTNIRITVIRLLALIVCTAFVFLCFSVINSSIGAISISSAFLVLPLMVKNNNISFLPQTMCRYQLYDLNYTFSLLINIMLFIIMFALSILFWKRESNSK